MNLEPSRSRRSDTLTLNMNAKTRKRIELAVSVLGAVFGFAGTVLAILSLAQSRDAAAAANTATAAANRATANQQLADAWDLLGGRPGTVSIARPTNDATALELARRLIKEKALVIDPTNPKGHRYLAVYLYAVGDPRSALDELEKALRLDPADKATQFSS